MTQQRGRRHAALHVGRVIAWPEIRRLKQPGGKREMTAARNALSLAPQALPHIRYI
ncbi:hypothetical protein [Burkholderia sp. IMCC1007]|uniref:hypothetical protein n=1 Tax=Burkholderia sp. IMCC1007 TaxID=3004104 RepID=UPI0022B2F0B4|nr:hypothetical protein [Burkholderia sp. IMCC1007]